MAGLGRHHSGVGRAGACGIRAGIDVAGMIAQRSDTDTGFACVQCKQSVAKPFGCRPDEYLVCDTCVSEHPSVVKPAEEAPDLSENMWRIMLGDKS